MIEPDKEEAAMGDVVELHPLRLEENSEFVADCCRFFESLITEQTMRRKYKFSEDVWQRLGDDEELLLAIENEKIRRMRNGSAKREKAQLLVLQAPGVLSNLLLDEKVSPRFRIDSAKTLDALAANGPTSVPVGDKFQIILNLGTGSDGKEIVETYDKSVSICVDDPEESRANPVVVKVDEPPENHMESQQSAPAIPFAAFDADDTSDPPRRKPGRPRGSRNKPKLVKQD
jgi:hypothetical protein